MTIVAHQPVSRVLSETQSFFKGEPYCQSTSFRDARVKDNTFVLNAYACACPAKDAPGG